MGRVLERIVLPVDSARFDGHDFTVNGDHCVAESVEFGLRFAFGGLDHQRSGDRPAQRRRMEAVIHQPLGDVFGGDALEIAEVKDTFVRHETAVPPVECREILFQPFGDVVGVEDGNFCRLRQAG